MPQDTSLSLPALTIVPEMASLAAALSGMLWFTFFLIWAFFSFISHRQLPVIVD